LVAYNVNLNTSSVKKANSIAFDIREQGRIVKKNGETITDEHGQPVRHAGMLKSVKAIGWYIEEYGVAQISMNLTNINVTALHTAFDACDDGARDRGIRVTGSEIVGMIPKKVLIDAGKHYLEKQKLSAGLSERDLMKLAVKTLGLEEFAPFPLDKKIIEYAIAKPEDTMLADLTVAGYADLTASESPAPGGGSASAAVGAFGVALGVMVANLTSTKKGYEKHWKMYSDYAVKGQEIKQRLLHLIDEDTRSYNGIIQAIRLPKGTDEEIAIRKKAMIDATRYAIEVPYQAMVTAAEAIPIISAMVEKGNPNSVSDAAVGGLCLRTAITGAFYNVLINMKGFDDVVFADAMRADANTLFDKSMVELDRIAAMLKEHF